MYVHTHSHTQEYHDLMKKYVGHVDVSVKDELGLDTKQANKASKAAATSQKVLVGSHVASGRIH